MKDLHSHSLHECKTVTKKNQHNQSLTFNELVGSIEELLAVSIPCFVTTQQWGKDWRPRWRIS